jgi:Tfp pilus assembly protein PilE
MWKSNDKNVMTFTLLNKKRALSLVELVVITFIIAVIATMAFPAYKIFQQRSKEKRLKKILTDVRAAINGTKSHNSTNEFEEGFRTVARVEGIKRIENAANLKGWNSPATLPDNAKDVKQKCINAFIAKFSEGYGYPKSPKEIWSSNPIAAFPAKLTGFCPGTGDDILFNEVDIGDIPLERPFYRNCDVSSGPVHPFHDWYPTVEFQYVPVIDRTGNSLGTSYRYNEWIANEGDLVGVKDIVSRGVGLALDGSNTDDW